MNLAKTLEGCLGLADKKGQFICTTLGDECPTKVACSECAFSGQNEQKLKEAINQLKILEL